jgi:hypothetical protein
MNDPHNTFRLPSGIALSDTVELRYMHSQWMMSVKERSKKASKIEIFC